MNKFLRGVAIVVSIFLLASCGFNSTQSSSDGKASTSNSDVAVEVISGSYVVPPGESTVNGENYLALNVKITNKTDGKLTLYTNSFSLYDSEDRKVTTYNVYGDNDEFQTLSSETISSGKSLTTYLVYKVDKKAKYELHFEPMLSDYEKELKEVSLKVDSSKYEDHTEEILDLAKDYVNGVFLNGEEAVNTTTLSNDSFNSQVVPLSDSSSKSEDKEDKDEIRLANNLQEERSTFSNLFISTFSDEFSYYEPSQAELKTFIDTYTSANAKKATIQYSIKSYTIDAAEIYIKPQTIDIASIDTTSIIDDFLDNNRDSYSNYTDAYKAAEKYILEQLPTKLETTGLSSGDYMPGEGYAVRLTKDKESNKWTLDSSDTSSNYEFEKLQSIFMGNLY